LREKTETMPKALVEIGGRPILWHVIEIYARQGFERFILCTGYLGEMIERFADAETWPARLSVECLETGDATPTGGRVLAAAQALTGEAFCLTYADGLADIDLGALLAHHRSGGATATVTVVRPNLQWGVAHLGEGDRIEGFTEKPRSDHWINGGFFCFEPGIEDYLSPDSILERVPLERLAAEGELTGYPHRGFWECLDTYKDAVTLNDLWRSGAAPWLPAA
jgi:glucose-1-phosphate cytidylyltransferase